MIKYFCDRCSTLLQPSDQNVFIRLDEKSGIFISALAVTGDSKPVRDICCNCIVDILVKGIPRQSIQPVQIKKEPEDPKQITPMPVQPPTSTVATLQPPLTSEVHSFDQTKAAPQPIYEQTQPE